MLTDIVVALSSGIYCREANFTRPKSETRKSRLIEIIELINCVHNVVIPSRADGEEPHSCNQLFRCAKRDQSAQVRSFASLRMTPRRRGMVISSPAHKTIVSPRVGPTLTIDNFAPANSGMYLTYFFAAEG